MMIGLSLHGCQIYNNLGALRDGSVFLFDDHGLLQPFMMLIQKCALPNLRLYYSFTNASDSTIMVNHHSLILFLELPLRSSVKRHFNLKSMLLKHLRITILRCYRLLLLGLVTRIHQLLLLFELASTLEVNLVDVPECSIAFKYFLRGQFLRSLVFPAILNRALRPQTA